MDLHRRHVLAGLAFGALSSEVEAAAAAEADDAAAVHESLYIPKAHVVDDRKFLHEFMDEFAFVDLITSTPTLRITHIPCYMDRTRGEFGTIFGHISKNNPQNQTFDGEHPAVIVFRGPHGYISPSWYAKPESSVPTWNFGVVHASGKLQGVTDKVTLRKMLAKLIDKNEDYAKSKYDFSKLPDSYIGGMLGGIVGFEMKIELLEGKFKLGHERGEAERTNVVEHLKTGKRERSFADFTADFYKSHPAKA